MEMKIVIDTNKVILDKAKVVSEDKSNRGRYTYGRIVITLPPQYINRKVRVIVVEE